MQLWNTKKEAIHAEFDQIVTNIEQGKQPFTEVEKGQGFIDPLWDRGIKQKLRDIENTRYESVQFPSAPSELTLQSFSDKTQSKESMIEAIQQRCTATLEDLTSRIKTFIQSATQALIAKFQVCDVAGLNLNNKKEIQQRRDEIFNKINPSPQTSGAKPA